MDLGISDTCILRGNYYHLLHEIWPNEHNFGKILSIDKATPIKGNKF